MTGGTWPWINAGVGLLVILTAGLAVIALAVLWRRGYVQGWHAARKTPPTCIRCGYNLSGLTQCRCPECGSEFRLEELWRKAIYSTKSRQIQEPAGRPPATPRSQEELIP